MENKNSREYLKNLRHSCAHLLAAAVMDLYPKTKRTIGPAIDNGFYYDFDFAEPISDTDLPNIEKKMRELSKNWKEFTHVEVSKEEALKKAEGNEYKQELIEEFTSEGQKITFYSCGGFEDLCRGGHCENPSKEMRNFKLTALAGAYWRGNEKNKMLTRIYGSCFPTKEELDEHLRMLEEAKKSDHRVLGEKLELFTISEKVGRGLILWLPKGNIIKEQLEEFAKETEKAQGYLRVTTPNITKAGLYYTSGHLPYYKKDMYPPMKLEDGDEYFLKPMNCPHHHMIYANRPKSYRELPYRLAEYGTCYRYEASGELFGLMRVRGFTQNDAHIYCTVEQAVDEFVNVMKLHEYYYKSLGIEKYHLELALRDPNNKEKYHGDDAMWQLAEELMRKAVRRVNIPMVEEQGSAAFYGPKIDFIIHSKTGRQFAVSTNQIDIFMGKRFGLTYVDKDGSDKTPVIIHRAPLGSHERFIGFLIEHYGGAFPLWLAPIQVVVLPVSDKFIDKAVSAQEQLLAAGIRVELDSSAKTLGAKIREWTLQKTSYLCIIGEKEAEGHVSIRSRDGKDLGTQPLSRFIEGLQTEIGNKKT